MSELFIEKRIWTEFFSLLFKESSYNIHLCAQSLLIDLKNFFSFGGHLDLSDNSVVSSTVS